MLGLFTYCRTSLCSRLYFPPFFKATLWIPSIARSIDCSTSSCSGVCQRQKTTEWHKYLFIKNVIRSNPTEPWACVASGGKKLGQLSNKKLHFNQ